MAFTVQMSQMSKNVEINMIYQASREWRWSGVVGSGLRGGEVTYAAAFAQFLLQ